MRMRQKSPIVLVVVLIAAAVGYLQKDRPGRGSAVPIPNERARPTAPTAEAPAPESTVGVRIRVRRIVDGDTLEAQLDDGRVEKIRVFGVNAPELHARPGTPKDTFTPQAFAQEASDRLTVLCPPGGDARIVERGRDKYGRLLAQLYTREGLDVSRKLIEEGLGRSYFVLESKHDGLRPYYEASQEKAKVAGKGIWSLPVTH